MTKVVATQVIWAAHTAVWDVFARLEDRSGPSEVEHVELLSPGPFGQGTRWRETRFDRSGRPVTAELEVLEVDPGRSATIGLSEGRGGGQLIYEFTPIAPVGGRPAATRVTLTAQGRAHDLTNRLLLFFLGTLAARSAEGALRDELTALAAACAGRGLVGPAAA